MLPLLVDPSGAWVTTLVPVVALIAMLMVAFAATHGYTEAAVGLVAAGAVIASGDLARSRIIAELGHLLPVVAFLVAIFVVAAACVAEGLFTAVGATIARLGRANPQRLLSFTFVAAAVTTVTLSLDATVVLLTPVVTVAATSSMVSPRPIVHACVRLANSASLLLPVSNLTNLLALPSLEISFLRFLALMAPVWVAVIAVEYAGLRIFFAEDLRAVPGPTPSLSKPPIPRFALIVVVLMLGGFAVASPLHLAVAWVAGGAALVLTAHALATHRRGPSYLKAMHLGFGIYVLCLGIVVVGLTDTFLGDVVAGLVPQSTSLAGLGAIALLATVLANLVNNLPATLLLVPLVAPLGTTGVLAALIGLNVGSGLTYTGSLANLLWRRAAGPAASTGRDFHLLAALVTPPALVVAVLVLWAWSKVIGG